MKPLFMWAGGKTRLLKKYKEKGVLPETFDSYIEPFLGAGAMFVWAYNKNPNAKFYLNDSNQFIMNIYTAIKNDVDSFMSIMDDYSSAYIPLDKEHRKTFYYDLRTKHAFDYSKWSKTEEAASLYF